jgi:hypothetical protein
MELEREGRETYKERERDGDGSERNWRETLWIASCSEAIEGKVVVEIHGEIPSLSLSPSVYGTSAKQRENSH